MENNFSRIGDNCYSFHLQNSDKILEVVIHSEPYHTKQKKYDISKDSALNNIQQKIYDVSKKIADFLTENNHLVLKNEEICIKVNDSYIILKPMISKKISITNFVKNTENKNLIQYKLKVVSLLLLALRKEKKFVNGLV